MSTDNSNHWDNKIAEAKAERDRARRGTLSLGPSYANKIAPLKNNIKVIEDARNLEEGEGFDEALFYYIDNITDI